MISDTLWQACEDLEEYLRDPVFEELYDDSVRLMVRDLVKDLVDDMRELATVLDTPPVSEPGQ